jgi:hypothetical protein
MNLPDSWPSAPHSNAWICWSEPVKVFYTSRQVSLLQRASRLQVETHLTSGHLSLLPLTIYNPHPDSWTSRICIHNGCWVDTLKTWKSFNKANTIPCALGMAIYSPHVGYFCRVSPSVWYIQHPDWLYLLLMKLTGAQGVMRIARFF